MDRVDYQTLIVQDLVNLKKANELELSPWYQRRSVWNPAQKSYLINTLLEQKPIPAIYIRHSIDLEASKSIKEIVDGQQRTRTILEYCSDLFSANHHRYPKKVKFSQLSKDEQQKFLLTAVPVGYLLGASDADVIDIFGRINSVSKSLNAQEKRNAAFSGEMKQFCLKQSADRTSFWRTYGIFTANDISRMNEVQFISDLTYNLINGLSDFSSKKLDELYKKFDEQFEEKEELSKKLDKAIDAIGSLDPKRIADTIFSRQPLFFSLLIIIDELKNYAPEKIEKVILEVDSRYNSEENRTDEDINFEKACTSSTQRIAQRKVRDQYIKSFF